MVPRPTLRLLAFCTAMALLARVGAADVAPLGCTTGSISGFKGLVPCGTTTFNFSWNQVTGATSYELMQSVAYPDYCSVPSDITTIPFHVADTTSSTQSTLTGLAPNSVFVFFVRLPSCSTYRSGFVVGDTFTTGPAVPVVSAAVTGAGQVTLSYAQPDPKTFAIQSIERAFNGGAFAPIGNVSPSFQNYCPAGHTFTYVDSGLADGIYTYRVTNIGNAGNCYVPVVSRVAGVTLGCPGPSAPTLGGPQSAVSGKAVAFIWTMPTDLAAGGSYVLETSTDGFKTIATVSGVTTSAVLSTTPSNVDVFLSARVRAVQSCGTSSLASNVVSVHLLASPATFVLKTAAPPLTAVAGGAQPSAVLTLKNVGGRSDTVSFRPPDFVGVSPGSVSVAPGAEAAVTLTATGSAVASPGFFSGPLYASWSSGSLTTPVTLRVVLSDVASGAKARADVATLLFSAPAGQQPAPQNITVTVTPPPLGSARGLAAVPVRLVPSVGPGGAWISISDNVGAAVSAPGQLTLTLSVDRSRRSPEEGSNLFRTNLLLTPFGGDPRTDAAVVEVIDVDALPFVSGVGLRSSAPPPTGSSFILATAVKAVSGLDATQVFTSDGWFRNFSSSPVTADFFCTVDGVDGVSGTGGIRKTSVTVPPNGLFRTSDLMTTVFSAPLGISANIEVRSSAVGALSYRSTTDSVKGGDPASRFGTEIPAVSYGSGVALGQDELVVVGIDSDAQNRSNLILAETSGSPATVQVTVNGQDGALLKTITKDVPSLGKVQINNSDLAPAGTTGGWVGVKVISGAGHVVPVATVIDNASGSFSAVLGQALRPTPPTAGRPKALAAARRYLMPTAVRTTGQFNTSYSTSMSMVNGTNTTANLTFTYRYTDLDDGGAVKTAVQTRAIGPRAAFPKSLGSDLLGSFFGVTNRSFGSIYVDGDVTRVTGVVSVSTQADPNDPTKGLKTSQVPGVFLDSPSVMPLGAQQHRFSGLEKSTQKRSNLILIEVDGQPTSVMVHLTNAAGDDLGTQTFSVGPNEYRQITDVFGGGGVNAGDGPFQNAEVSAGVVSGSGRVLALATVIDNVSFNPEIFILTPPAPPPDPTIGF
jgi:hypothetical protein